MPLANLLAGRELLNRYLVEGVLGEGGMGIVCRATDTRLQRPVAIKVLSTISSNADVRLRARRRFQREAVTAAGLRHPNVVRIYDYGTDPELDLDILVMELLEGHDLSELLSSNGPFAPSIAVDLIDQAARGLGAGHKQGLIHRDVKPSNLFVSIEGRRHHLQVLDFGIVEIADRAETITHLTIAGSDPHTPKYAAPEQLTSAGQATPATDVYSLGLTAFEMLTGEPALPGLPSLRDREDLPELLYQRMKGCGVPEGLRGIVKRAVGYEPCLRYADGDRLADALADLHMSRDEGAYTSEAKQSIGGGSGLESGKLSWKGSVPSPEGKLQRSFTFASLSAVFGGIAALTVLLIVVDTDVDDHLPFPTNFVAGVGVAAPWMEAAADIDSLYQAGRKAYEERRIAEAILPLRRAADLGHVEAQVLAAHIVNREPGVSRDHQAALRWNRAAHRNGSVLAGYNLGFMYDNGWGAPEDDRRAVALYREAAEAGLPRAQFSLGRMYQFGLGVPEDRNEAIRWMRIALANGEERATQILVELESGEP
jgi:serine/threonine protein kinase